MPVPQSISRLPQRFLRTCKPHAASAGAAEGADLLLLDDEYGRAGEADPRVLVTTSRDPSSRLSQFAKVRSWGGVVGWEMGGALVRQGATR